MIDWRHVNPGHLQAVFRDDVEAFLDRSPYFWTVVSGYRSLEEQALLYAAHQQGGPRAAPPGKSAHNFGLAVDVVLDGDPATPGLQPTWNTKLAGWGWLKAASIPHPRLRGGWRFGDWPHLERHRWQRFTEDWTPPRVLPPRRLV